MFIQLLRVLPLRTVRWTESRWETKSHV